MQFTRRRVLAFLVLTCILLMTLDARGNSTIDSGKSFFADVFSPLKGVGRMISTPVRNGWKGITNYDELQRENDLLRERIASQQGDSIAAQAALRDFQELSAQLDLPALTDFTNLTAQVLSYSATNTQQTVEINRGTSKGVAIGMPVVNGAGLVGKVVEVFENSALVLLISDPSFSVTCRIVGTQEVFGVEPSTGGEASNGGEDPASTDPVGGETPPTDGGPTTTDETSTASPESTDGATIGDTLPPGLTEEQVLAARAEAEANAGAGIPPIPTTIVPTTTTLLDISQLVNRERGSLEGVGRDKNPVVRFINNDNKANKIKPGDVVITDGGSESLAPAGLNIGVVKTVTPRAGTQGPLIEIQPAADLSQINYVRVIMYLPESEIPG
jgi:cell shape-determining protein MreC